MSVELIAEISSNHGGSVALAKEFIWRCAEAGADWVKFQHTRVAHLRRDDPQYEWFKRAELSVEQFAELKAECEQAGVKFLTTVYNAADVPEVVGLGCNVVKIGSGEAKSRALADAVMESPFLRVFVALGLCGGNPYESAFAREEYWGRPIFLGTVTRYPAPQGIAANVLRDGSRGWATTGNWHRVTGWSDHAVGLSECFAAIDAGATIIEKHVQLPQQARPCKPYEATMEELKALRQFADENPARFIGRWQHA